MYFFPCDTAPELKTRSPKGMVEVFPRKIDLENVEKLKTFENIKVVMNFYELEKEIMNREKCQKK